MNGSAAFKAEGGKVYPLTSATAGPLVSQIGHALISPKGVVARVEHLPIGKGGTYKTHGWIAREAFGYPDDSDYPRGALIAALKDGFLRICVEQHTLGMLVLASYVRTQQPHISLLADFRPPHLGVLVELVSPDTNPDEHRDLLMPVLGHVRHSSLSSAGENQITWMTDEGDKSRTLISGTLGQHLQALQTHIKESR